ncbi:hypothetical protein D6C84_08838, partial [Aureobasidium pullulans]
NTDPKAIRAVQNNKNNSSPNTAYGHTPGTVGLRGWQPPQAHMFVSAPSSVSGFPTTAQQPRGSVSPTTAIDQTRHSNSSTESRSLNRASGSPLKVRKTRENLRKGYLNDAVSKGAHSVPDLTYSKHTGVQPLRKIQNIVHDEVVRPPSTNPRFSWESNSIHLTTVIEQSPSKRTSNQSNRTEPKSAPSLSRKLSVRKRVVSRVKDGLLSRSKSSSKAPVKTEDDVTTSRSASEHERFTQNSANKSFQNMKKEHIIASQLLAFESVQSFVSTDSPTVDISSTLLALSPLQPDIKGVFLGSDGSFPSPSQRAQPSPSPSPEKTPRPDRRSTWSAKVHLSILPKPLTMLHINLSVTPAWNTLDLADEAQMWAMIKAEAAVSSEPPIDTDEASSAVPSQHVGKSHKFLDVVVIIDNSFALTRGRPLASSLALQSISEFTRHLCSLLRDHGDRLAVFCTYCSHESRCSDTMSGCQLHRLQRPNATALSIDVARLDPSKATAPPAATQMSAMMQEAVASVVERRQDSNDSVTHAFVLSPLPRICTSMLRKLVSWPIHQVQFGYAYDAPFPQDQAGANGWCFEWDADHHTTLDVLIQSAREESSHQELSHVRVSINSAEPCRVERLLTPPRKATLHPGQCTTLFAKVRIPSISERPTADPKSIEGLFSDLHETLGNVKNELFKADVRYRHSLLPRSTVLRTELACELIRTNRNSQWGSTHEEEDKDGLEVEIEKAKFAARNYPPDVAIKILHKKFGKFWSGKNGPPILHSLREELEFQQKVSAETTKSVAQSSSTAIQRQASRSTRRTTMHFPDTEALQVFNTAPSTPTPEESNTSIATPTSESRSDHGQRPDSLVIQDEARRIWRHMRRNSRTTSGISSASEASSRAESGAQQQQRPQRRGSQESVMDRMAAADTRVNELRLKALQNKRSVGAETLRDFSMMQRQHEDELDESRYEANLPWL